jgi:ribonuclease P protein component
MKNKDFKSLKLKKIIDKLFKGSRSVSNNFFIIKYTSDEIIKNSYVITPSKKNFKTAVLRNKIKRQIRTFI